MSRGGVIDAPVRYEYAKDTAEYKKTLADSQIFKRQIFKRRLSSLSVLKLEILKFFHVITKPGTTITHPGTFKKTIILQKIYPSPNYFLYVQQGPILFYKKVAKGIKCNTKGVVICFLQNLKNV